MDDAAQEYYIDLMRKVYESDRWKEYTEKNGLFREWLAGDDLGAYFANEVKKHRNLLEETGKI
jgi:tripartite-type tricarboxylate transporter receptor subunit TctC